MPLQLSWKQKFRWLIAICLLGLAVMAGSALWVNERLASAFHAQQVATDFQAQSTELLNDWLRLRNLRAQLTPETVERFGEQLSSLEVSAKAFAEASRQLNDEPTIKRAEKIAALLDSDLTLQRQWLELNQSLGLRATDKLRQSLVLAAAELEKINIGLIQPFVATALTKQRDYLSTFDPSFAANAREAIAAMQKQIIELDWQDSKVGESVREYEQTFGLADALIGQIRDVQEQMKTQAATIETTVDELDTALANGIVASTGREVEQARQSTLIILGLTFLGGSIFLMITLGRASGALFGQLKRVTDLLARVAAGDLTGQLAIGNNRKDEFNQLGIATNDMIQRVGGLIRQVADGNRDMERLYAHLKEAMNRLEVNSEQVEQQTEQAASASHQISATVSEIARRTNEVGTASQSACNSAQVGSQIIGSSVDNIRRLSGLIRTTHEQVVSLTQSGKQVNSIIGVINGLAEQTNLLALNAAIEAARAGEAGRGFSVVADEVRSLAQKTVAATTDIAAIVSELDRQTRKMDELIGSGLSLAQQSETDAGEVAGAIGDITQSVETLTAEMSQVVVAVEEISATTDDIAMKMEDINTHTGETRTLRQTLDTHTQGLQSQVEALSERTGKFRVV
ncbi:methyl-accepting chemotaxis protein [Pseudomonas stutzeri]|uniref:methyl-accepting chemotaxis protein n=1 Tax=Stutzerimonas stutzeri TaxID=316 RepID=UPI0021096981|nr:methyl-accepting chemotaxis protein [Stutzerimonas stutzeri]MCQ4310876.1 methyl-accepting chemotaxis protein [Stutzerimonas stutzeri]